SLCIAAHDAPALSDEDNEQDPDRWCSHAAWGQECWQVVSQWVWNEAPGAGASAGTDARTHDRVCPCSPAAERATCHASGLISTRVRVWSTHDGHLLEDGSLLGARLSSPARWDPPLPSRPGASCPGAASRSRWQSAHGVCGGTDALHWKPYRVEKPMAVCAWCMRPASAVAIPARCASSVNGRATLRR